MGRKLFFGLLKESLKDMRVASPSYFKKVTKTDILLDSTFLRFIPRWMTPNHFTILRFISIPLLITILLADYMVIGTILFAISAFSDAIDGALARTRNQITNWGIVKIGRAHV